MKTKYTTSFLFIAIFLATFFTFMRDQAYATHLSGGEITYTHVQGNCYNIRLTFFRDCIGIAIVQPIIVNISSASCAQSTTLQLDQLPGTGQEITHPCPGHISTCSGGTEPGIQKWEFESQYCFPGQCADWIISISMSARNAAITTLQNPGGDDIYIEAKLNNLNGDNNSPQFTIDPNIFLCIGEDLTINHGIVDPDGDSLVCSIIAARTDQNTPVLYNVGYSSIQPLSSQTAITIDPNSGDLFLHPTIQEVGPIAFQVDEYRNGSIIGSVMQDLCVYTVSCSNNVMPTVSGLNGSSLNSIYILADQPTCFNIFCDDSNATDSLTMIWNNGIPSAIFSVQAASRPTGVFCWSPTPADVRPQPYIFTVTALDLNCPTQGYTSKYFLIYVTNDSTLVTPPFLEGYFSGEIYYDANSNGVKDSTDINVPSQSISVQPDNISMFTNTNGEYIFYCPTSGNHVITVNPFNNWIITSDSLSYTVTYDSTDHSGLDFGINALNPENGLNVAVVQAFPRCNSNRYYHINYQNTGSTLLNGRIIFNIDSAVTFTSSIPQPDQISGDSLIYNFTNLWPTYSSQISMELFLPGGGDTIHFEALAQFDSSGNYVTADSESFQQIVSCAIDPNDKLVLPEGLYSDHRTLYNEELQYTIRFQNTGNDTAFLVIIHDFIDPSLDLSTLQICGNSHPLNTTIFPNRMVEFKFDNILLPDSNVDEPGSNGYIQYRIRPMSNLQLPVVVRNEADIFFDSNFPVLTNNVWNTLVSDLYVGTTQVLGTNEIITVVPNPFSNNARLIFSKSFINTETTLVLIDAMGRTVNKKMVNGSEIIITKGNLNPGIYFFELSNGAGNRATGKLVIE